MAGGEQAGVWNTHILGWNLQLVLVTNYNISDFFHNFSIFN